MATAAWSWEGNVNAGLYVPTRWRNFGLQSYISLLNGDDLPGTYDFRDIFLEILQDRLSTDVSPASLFPEFTPGTPLNFLA